MHPYLSAEAVIVIKKINFVKNLENVFKKKFKKV